MSITIPCLINTLLSIQFYKLIDGSLEKENNIMIKQIITGKCSTKIYTYICELGGCARNSLISYFIYSKIISNFIFSAEHKSSEIRKSKEDSTDWECVLDKRSTIFERESNLELTIKWALALIKRCWVKRNSLKLINKLIIQAFRKL